MTFLKNNIQHNKYLFVYIHRSSHGTTNKGVLCLCGESHVSNPNSRAQYNIVYPKLPFLTSS